MVSDTESSLGLSLGELTILNNNNLYYNLIMFGGPGQNNLIKVQFYVSCLL